MSTALALQRRHATVILTGLFKHPYLSKFKREDLENQAGRGAFARRTRSVAFLHKYRTGIATTTCEDYLDRTF
ncbi:hypothetical protein BAQ48_10560 [Bacillus luti]|nr:hypothetical protein BAQ48_10560 [Bacillus luti]